MADKPSKGLADVVAASTALSDIDGQAGRLSYRGYDIHQLAGAATFEEIAYLLQRGSPPDEAELDSFEALLNSPDQEVYDWLRGYAPVPPTHDTTVFHQLKSICSRQNPTWNV